MFTGIIEALGEVKSVCPSRTGKIITISLPFAWDDLVIGQSICVNGACLTLERTEKEKGTFFLSRVTLNTTNLGHLKSSDKVNLERPLRLNQGLGGHILTGHIDIMSKILSIHGQDIKFSLPAQIAPFLVQKGSVAIDGISLTIASIEKDHYWVNIIPHTWENTNLSYRHDGDMVNVESDIIAKHVFRLLNFVQPMINEEVKVRSLTIENLLSAGFLFED